VTPLSYMVQDQGVEGHRVKSRAEEDPLLAEDLRGGPRREVVLLACMDLAEVLEPEYDHASGEHTVLVEADERPFAGQGGPDSDLLFQGQGDPGGDYHAEDKAQPGPGVAGAGCAGQPQEAEELRALVHFPGAEGAEPKQHLKQEKYRFR
jgi:hypothetical protein